jgi:hypothetical protein
VPERLQLIQGGGDNVRCKEECDAIAREVIKSLTRDGAATATSVDQMHRLLKTLHFRLVSRKGDGLPGNVHLLWLHEGGYVLVRLKTKGTQRRPHPHMTVSLSKYGLWGRSDEAAKYDRTGRLRTATLVDGSRGDFAGLERPYLAVVAVPQGTGRSFATAMTESMDQVHFNFGIGFDDSAARTLPIEA